MENELHTPSAAGERLARVEAQQKALHRLLLALIAVLAVFILLLGALLVPTLHRYNAALDSLQRVGNAFAETDPKAMAALLEKLAALDLSGLEALDAAALDAAAEKLAKIDPEALQGALKKLQQVDIDRLNGALTQMEKALADLDGLDIDAVNTAIRNLNKTLGPLLTLFDR